MQSCMAKYSGSESYPVVDLFAGPGGLGEGFSSLKGEKGKVRFNSVLAVERDEFAHQTLLLRHFVKAFKNGRIPEAYYEYLAGNVTLEALYARHKDEARIASFSTLRLSLGLESRATVRDYIRRRLANSKKWVLVGGPPCQAYSLVGRSRMMNQADFDSDERHFLYKEYLNVIADHRPPVFVMENVKGLLSAVVNGQSVINLIVGDLTNPGKARKGSTGGSDLSYKLYSLSEGEAIDPRHIDPALFMVKAEEYGVPQARHRMFIVGVREDIKVRPRFLRKHNAPTVHTTIGNLPRIRSGISRGKDSQNQWVFELNELANMSIDASSVHPKLQDEIASGIRKAVNMRDRKSERYPSRPKSTHPAIQSLFDPNLRVLTDHESRTHMASDLRRYMFASAFAKVSNRSPVLGDFPESLLPDHANVDAGRKGKMFSDRFRVQMANRVSTTVTSHISKDGHAYIHYDPAQCRSLTVREAARLQTFPDNYHFEGPRTSKYHQVGNAVPPYLSGQIAAVIAELLDSIR